MTKLQSVSERVSAQPAHTKVYTLCKVNDVDRLNRYYTLYIWRKWFAWSDSSTNKYM